MALPKKLSWIRAWYMIYTIYILYIYIMYNTYTYYYIFHLCNIYLYISQTVYHTIKCFIQKLHDTKFAEFQYQ